MSAICDVDLATYCGRVGRVYGQHRLCPPFALRHAAESWITKGIPLTHCVEVIERFLSRHAGSCYSGSGDWNFAWLNTLIQTSWYERSFARPPGPAPQQSRRDNWGDNYGFEQPNQRPGRTAAFTVQLPDRDSKLDSFAPAGIALRQKPVGKFSSVKDTKSASPLQIRRPKHRGSSLAPGPSPKKIDTAVAWLRIELAAGERAAAVVDAKALSAGIAPRTYDRARKRLGIVSRRLGFGRWARYVIALPTVHGTPKVNSTDAGAT